GTITLSLTLRDGWVGVAVHDTGIGIPAEQQEHIFDRFYRVDKARSRDVGGSGLGLSIVQWIAQAHQGYMTLESEIHKGSSFMLWLPELQVGSGPPEVTTPPPHLTTASPVLSSAD